MRYLVFTVAVLLSLSYYLPDLRLYGAIEIEPLEICAERPFPDSLKADRHLLARLVNAEAGGEPAVGKWAVADAAVHTAKYHGWSIHRTVFDGGRFDGIHLPVFSDEPPQSCLDVAGAALVGKHWLPYGVFYFYNPVTSTDTAWINYIGKYQYGDIENHRFCWHPDFIPENN